MKAWLPPFRFLRKLGRMIVRHVPSRAEPALCSATQRSWLYRTEVENNNDHPIRVIWFDFSYYEDCHGDGDGDWFSTNIRKRTLRNADFIDWYGDGSSEPSEGDGWLAPGAIAACDPNYCWAFGDEITPVKWSFIAVDAEGNDYFAEALVEQSAATLFEPAGD